MATFISLLYALALVTSLACMVLLFRAYAATGMRLLLFMLYGFVWEAE